MPAQTFTQSCCQAAAWWIRRNPSYLLSAAAMAAGARLYLYDPAARTDDVGLMLRTAGLLQLYELAVCTVLLLLHRRGRLGNDIGSLLLVGTCFWTGPLLATLELTQQSAALGTPLALAAAAFAWLEFEAVVRLLRLRLSPPGRLLAAGTLLFLTAAQILLRVPPDSGGISELALYRTWLLLAGIALVPVAVVRWHARRSGAASPIPRALLLELGFLALVLLAAAAQLYAMNYAYFGHARRFYGAPLLIAVCAVVAELRAAFPAGRPRWKWLCGALPLAAVLMSAQGFDPEVDTTTLAAPLRDPPATALLLTAVVWLYVFARLRAWPLFHAGALALGGFACRLLVVNAWMPGGFTAAPSPLVPLSGPVVGGIYALAGYLLLIGAVRRSRGEMIAALCVHAVALIALLAGRTSGAGLANWLIAGWTFLLVIHVARRQPPWSLVLTPVLALALVSAFYEFSPQMHWFARLHAVLLVAACLLAGRIWSARQYVLAGVAAGGIWLLALAGGVIRGSENALAGLSVLGAFALLAIGAAVSWSREVWLGRLHNAAAEAAGGSGADGVDAFERLGPAGSLSAPRDPEK